MMLPLEFCIHSMHIFARLHRFHAPPSEGNNSIFSHKSSERLESDNTITFVFSVPRQCYAVAGIPSALKRSNVCSCVKAFSRFIRWPCKCMQIVQFFYFSTFKCTILYPILANDSRCICVLSAVYVLFKCALCIEHSESDCCAPISISISMALIMNGSEVF